MGPQVEREMSAAAAMLGLPCFLVLAGEDLRGHHPAVAQADPAAAGDHWVDLERGPVGFGGWQCWWSGGTAAGGGERGQVDRRQVRADGA